jgi:hypothetical protein
VVAYCEHEEALATAGIEAGLEIRAKCADIRGLAAFPAADDDSSFRDASLHVGTPSLVG